MVHTAKPISLTCSDRLGANEISLGRFALRETRWDFTDAAVSVSSPADLLICMRSWEDRSLHVLERFGSSARRIILFEFDPSFGVLVTSTAFDDIKQKCKPHKSLKVVKLGRSTDYYHNLEKIRSVLDAELSRRKNPVRTVCLDISAFSKGYTASMIGYLFGQKGAIWLRAMYAEAQYGPSLKPSALSIEIHGSTFELSGLGRFTDGDWQLKVVSHLAAHSDPRESRRIIAFCGGDEDRLILALQEYEVQERFVVVAASLSPESQANARERADSIATYTPLDKGNITQCHPHSIISAAKMLLERKPRRPSDASMLIMPFSTKPHGLASAVFCLAYDRTSMVARIPAAYVPRGADRTCRIWCYDIFDLTSPYVGSFL